LAAQVLRKTASACAAPKPHLCRGRPPTAAAPDRAARRIDGGGRAQPRHDAAGGQPAAGRPGARGRDPAGAAQHNGGAADGGGIVRLAASPSAAAALVPRAAAARRAAWPEVDLVLLEAGPPEAVAMVRAGEADVALVFRYGAAADDGLVREIQRDEPVVGRRG